MRAGDLQMWQLTSNDRSLAPTLVPMNPRASCSDFLVGFMQWIMAPTVVKKFVFFFSEGKKE